MEAFFDTKIIVALIAVIASFISLIIAKETKTSEFRQKWIDSIRDDIADLMGTLTQYSIVYIAQNPTDRESKEKFFNDNNELLAKVEISINKIELRLNPEDDKDLINHLNAISDFITIPQESKLGDLSTTMNKLKEQSHKLLKDEWERVKKGEWLYRTIKYIFGTVAFIFMIYFAYNVYQTIPITDNEHNKTLDRNSLP